MFGGSADGVNHPLPERRFASVVEAAGALPEAVGARRRRGGELGTGVMPGTVAAIGAKADQSAAQKKFHCLLKIPSGTEQYLEAIDQAIAESVAEYTRIITDSRNLFLGILGYDLRIR